MRSASLAALQEALRILEENVIHENSGSASVMDDGQLRLAIEDSIRSLEVVKNEHFRQRDIARNTAKPVHQIPVEILDCIIRNSLPDRAIPPEGSKYYRSLMSLSAVCKRWRDQILSTPNLWNFIPLDISPDLVSLALLRSKPASLDVCCYSPWMVREGGRRFIYRINRFAALVNPTSRRWRALTLVPHLGAVGALQTGLEESLSKLENVTLLGSIWSRPDESLGTVLRSEVRNMRRLSVKNVYLPFILNAATPLEELSLEGPENPTLEVLLGILRLTALSLRRLDLGSIRLRLAAGDESIQQLQPINLPELRLLSLGDQPAVPIKTFMTTLRAPKCMELKFKTGISHLSSSPLAEYLQQVFEHHIPTFQRIVSPGSKVELRLLYGAVELTCSGPTSSFNLEFRALPNQIGTWSQQVLPLLGEGHVPVHLMLGHHVDVLWDDWASNLPVQSINAFLDRGSLGDGSTDAGVERFLDYLGVRHPHNGSVSWNMDVLECLTIALQRSEYPLCKQMLERRYREFPRVAGLLVPQVQRPNPFRLTCRVRELDEAFRQDLATVIGPETQGGSCCACYANTDIARS